MRRGVPVGLVMILTVAVLTASCGGATGGPSLGGPSPGGGTDAAGATATVAPVTVAPDEAASMTIADVLRTDERFSWFVDICERVETPIADNGLAVWDWEPHRMGDHQEGVTVFAPTDAAFESLDPAVQEVLRDPEVDNKILYDLVGHHYVHRLYPRSDFEEGKQPTWRRSLSGPVMLTLDPLAWGGHAIVQPDLRAYNGIIHVIDGVVVTDDLAAAAAARG